MRIYLLCFWILIISCYRLPDKNQTIAIEIESSSNSDIVEFKVYNPNNETIWFRVYPLSAACQNYSKKGQKILRKKSTYSTYFPSKIDTIPTYKLIEPLKHITIKFPIYGFIDRNLDLSDMDTVFVICSYHNDKDKKKSKYNTYKGDIQIQPIFINLID